MNRILFPLILALLMICIFANGLAFAQNKDAGQITVSKCWAYPMSERGSEMVSDGERIFLGSLGAKVEALSFDGKKLWSSDLGGDITSNILALDNNLHLVTSTLGSRTEKPSGSVLRSLSKETGITSWIVKLPDAGRHFLHAYEDSVVIVSTNGIIQLLDTKSGSLRWKREVAAGFDAEPVFTAAKLIVAATERQIFSISLKSGEIESTRKVPYRVTSLGETPSNLIVVGDERGNVVSVNGSEKATWKFKSGGEISYLSVIGDNILAASHDNFVYYLQARNGDVAWKKRLSGRVLQIGNVMNRFTLVTSIDEHSAVFTDLTTGKVSGQIAFGEDESPVYPPTAFNGLIFVLTEKSAYAYSLNGCDPKKEGGREKIIPATASLK